MGRNRDDEDGCLSTEQIQISAYRAFTKFEFRVGRSQPEWHELEDDVRSSWCAMVNEVLVKFDDEEANHSVASLADESHQRFAEGITGELPSDFLRWEELDEPLRQIWRHLVRHIVNLLAYDTEDNEGKKIQDHEDIIDDHLRAKLEEIGFSEASPDQPKEPNHGGQPQGVIFDAAPAPEPQTQPADRGFERLDFERRRDELGDADGPVAGPAQRPGPKPRTLFYGEILVGGGFGS